MISGYGFSENTVFNFGSTPCEVESVTATDVTCRTPAHTTTTTVTGEMTAYDLMHNELVKLHRSLRSCLPQFHEFVIRLKTCR